MTLHNLNPQAASGNLMWESMLHQWENALSPHARGVKLCALLRNVSAPDEHALLDVISLQYRQPESERRWQMFEQAKMLGFTTPVGALALALFWSSGSMLPDDLAPIYAEPKHCQQMLHCVLVMLVSRLSDNPSEGTLLLLERMATLEVAE